MEDSAALVAGMEPLADYHDRYYNPAKVLSKLPKADGQDAK